MATSLEASLKLRDQFTAVLQSIDNSLNKTVQTMESFKQKATGPAQALKQMATMAQASVSKLNSGIRSGLSSAADVVKSMTERILTLFGNFGNRISEKLHLDGVVSKIASTFDNVKSKVSSVFSGIGNTVGSAFSSVTSKVSSAASSIGNVMSSVTSKISSGFSSAVNVVKNGVSRINGFFKQSGNAFKQYGSDLKNGFSGIKDSTQQATNSVKGFVTALGLMKAASAVVNVVKGSIDGAIDRFDTLNQFPKMMQAIGFSADDAAKSKDALVAGIDGLPTTLGEVVSTTQRIATLTRDLDGATKTTIALNNAFLASGSSSEDASRGLEQYVQMLSRGEVDMQSWRSLQETMGPALYDVATAFGFAGQSAQNDLYDALKAGNITFDQFNSKLIEMNEGVGGFAERALIGSEGIKTSFKNIRTAVTNGVEASIRKIDSLFEKMTGKNIAKNLDSVKQKVKDIFSSINGKVDESGNTIPGLLDKLPGLIQKVTPYVDVLKNAFNDVKGPISEAVNAVKKSLGDLTGGFGSAESINSFKDFVEGITDGIKKLASFAEEHSDSIAKLISVLPKLAAAFVGFKIGKTALSPLLTFGKGLTTILSATGKLGGNLGKAFFGMFKKTPKGNPLGDQGGSTSGPASMLNPLSTFLDTMNGFAKGATKIALVFGIIKLVEEAAQALKDVNDKVPQNIFELGPKLANMAIAITGMGVFVAAAGALAKRNPVAALAGLASIAAINHLLGDAAQAMQEIDQKVPDSIGDFAPKLANMAIAIGGLSIIAGVAGTFAASNPVAAVSGLAMVAAVSLELMLAAEAMKQVNDKVPSDIGDFASKVANIGIAISGMSALVGVLGAFVSSGIGAIVLAGGLASVALICGEIMIAAEAMQQLDAKVPDDLSNVKTKIDSIAEAIGYFTAANLGSVIDLFENAVGVINTAVITAGLKKLEDLAEGLQSFAKITIPKGVDKKIQEIEEIIQKFAGAKLEQLIDNAIWTVDLYIVKEAFDKLADIGNSLDSLANIKFNAAKVESNITKIQDTIDLLTNSGGLLSKIKNLVSNAIDTGSFAAADQAFKQLLNISESLTSLQGAKFNFNATKKVVEDVTNIVEMIGTSGLGELVGTMIKSSQLAEVKSALDAMNELVPPINQLGSSDVQAFSAAMKINLISVVIEALGTAGLGEVIGAMIKSSQLTEVKNALDALYNLVGPINQIGNADVQAIPACVKIVQIGAVIKQLGTSNLAEYFGTMIKGAQLGEVKDALIALRNLVDPINQFATAEIQADAAVTKVGDIGRVIKAIGTATFGELVGSMITAEAMNQVNTTIASLSSVRDAINNFAAGEINIEGVMETISNVKAVITQLNGFPEIVGVEGLQTLVTTFNTLATDLQGFVNTAQVSISGLQSVSSSFQSSMETMKSSTETTMAAIQSSASTGMAGFNSTIAAGTAQAAATARSGSAQIVAAFSGLRGQLQAAGAYAMSGLAAGIQAGAGSAIAAAQSVASRVTSTIQSALKIHSPSRVMMAIGEFVSIGLAKGILSAQSLVEKASNKLAGAAVISTPNQVPIETALVRQIQEQVIPADYSRLSQDLAYEGTSNVKLDDSEIEKIKASSNQVIVVKHKQVVPQVTIHVDNKDGEPIDTDALLQEFEDKIIELIDSDLS